jgi:hypothetical protein
MPLFCIGQQIGWWKIIAGPFRGKYHTEWECECACGIRKRVLESSLRRGVSISCGCFRGQHVAHNNTTHGLSKTITYRRWKGMIGRCYNPNGKTFKDYGGRGITVCQRWHESFPAFLADMGECPGSGYDLDRHPDNNGNYEPSNCRWALHRQNTRNTRRTRFLEDGGLRLTLIEWSERTGLRSSVIHTRIHRLGWSIHEALTIPAFTRGQHR